MHEQFICLLPLMKQMGTIIRETLLQVYMCFTLWAGIYMCKYLPFYQRFQLCSQDGRNPVLSTASYIFYELKHNKKEKKDHYNKNTNTSLNLHILFFDVKLYGREYITLKKDNNIHSAILAVVLFQISSLEKANHTGLTH